MINSKSVLRASHPPLRAPRSALRALSRRDFLYGLGLSLGTAAFNALLHGDERRGNGASPLSAKSPHHEAKAKACICLFMEGGPSHIDTFDPKPKLAELHMQ